MVEGNMGKLEVSHDILIAGSDFESCRQSVIRFFARTMLIRYDEVLVKEKESVTGGGEEFWNRVREGLGANQEVLGKFLANLKEEGFLSLDDLQGLEKGYLSKILHIIAHLQDGFIGVDSRFYNLEEDSHGVSRDLQRKMQATPGRYWILRVTGRITSAAEDSLDALRTFEVRGKPND
jgi:hypothetical protein